MSVAIKVPSVGESITEGIIDRWHKRSGEFIKEGEPLLELETDKATTTIPAPATGKLQIAAKEGEAVAIGAVVGSIDENAQEVRSATEAVRSAKSDVRSAENEAAPPSHLAPRTSNVAQPAPRTSNVAHRTSEGERRERLSPIRQRIADRLLASQKATATLTTFNEADISAVAALRARYKDAVKEAHEPPGLGLMPFFVKACVAALKAVPIVNAFMEGNEIVYHDTYHIGVAVSTEKGLIVPVVRDADRLSFVAVDRQIAELANKARDGKIAVQDLQGGTFTITNGGVFGSMLSTPILNPPQSAILGMHTIQKRPVAVEDRIEIRPMMYLALSYDHRLIDGRDAVGFLVKVKECIEKPVLMLLGT